MKATKYGFTLLVLYALSYLLPLEFRSLWQPDEFRYAEISREMLANHNWVVPHFFGLRYFEKPIAGYWINNISQLLFGHNNFAVRFGSVFSITVSALLVSWIASRIWQDRRITVFSAVIYLSCMLVYAIGTYAVLDPMITLWMTAAMAAFWLAASAETPGKRAIAYLLLGLTCGMGVMTKGFLALAIPVISIIPWVIVTRRWREVLIYGPLAVISATLITLPWALAINAREPDFWHYFFWVEHIQRFAESDAQHKAPFWYYVPVLLAGTLPWLGYLPAALKSGWQQRHQNHGAVYLLGWAVMPFLFFSIAKGKLPTYILPCFAPLAILLANVACRTYQQIKHSATANGWINLLFGLLGVTALLVSYLMPSHPLFAPHEITGLLLALLAFLFWAVIGLITLLRPEKRWCAAVLCPLVLVLTVGYTIPERIRDAKQPQDFLNQISHRMARSHYILAENVGIASGIAWQLKRQDINLFDESGEMRYGLAYPDGKGRLITRQQFPDWLATRRQQGVSMVFLLPKNKDLDQMQLPAPDFSYQQGRLLYVEYGPKK
ncbi:MULTISPECIES: lipid IV(A) 4-amino-4-deoxy-L-arabinosyltransferase [Tatumella]|uniref:Undecaprenyl phosphate-alpha-4-amino-4-deoxy-L-arabinose arabinosyl transferase n=1 Tax=Tatumella punctata TaxID=399969 RepID=A0ABW1VRL3_9GAMM|nr:MULTISPECIES: lipid IV(A) 4-amino-4-deoxy-L-arabinosyltransferase [unclassified Tatumella]MBS0876308.1 lipid IV(A) 4-amino-4-deoxy-L-arabinosyltransferase [Tatumella sp. JGM82]MBS0889481.1 lipid IV(A) 4-amino-4-deoxy-L-arabinosyltransferase [Tatumella sp. JGM94]MBS0894289.1 lipid IV(A) 4-amino-4-deoxy-L-arabinosyltransferase [Tatumella sp. JGM130]MBS0900603.1 lipid IV(A) 4-amino-4-deoxy-L-arabinosyltransferase [Tatumella sp. JGM100]